MINVRSCISKVCPLAILILLATYSTQAYSFRFWTHSKITGFSLNNSSNIPRFEFIDENGGSKIAIFSAKRIAVLKKESRAPDMERSGPDARGPNPLFHFDNETLDVGRQRAIDSRKEIIALMSEPNGEKTGKALARLGEVLHLIQDFYSHSNWVEKELFGEEQGIVNFGRDEEEWSAIETAKFRSSADLDKVIVCNEIGRPVANTSLTTGYYVSASEFNKIGKCSHGPSVSVLEIAPEIIYLSKDYDERNGYLNAFEKAVQETTTYIQSIIDSMEESGNIEGICALMDIEDDDCPTFKITGGDIFLGATLSDVGPDVRMDVSIPWTGYAEFPFRLFGEIIDCNVPGSFFGAGCRTGLMEVNPSVISTLTSQPFLIEGYDYCGPPRVRGTLGWSYTTRSYLVDARGVRTNPIDITLQCHIDN